MPTYDTPRTEVLNNLTSSVGGYLATQILAAIDQGGTTQSDITILDNYVPGDTIPAGTDIIILAPGQNAPLNVPPGVGAVIYTGPTGVQVDITVQQSVAVQFTEFADVIDLTFDTGSVPNSIAASGVTTQPTTQISVNLGAGDDVIHGASNAINNIIGGLGNDSMFGGNYNDNFDIGQGNDMVDGGTGYDKAYMHGSKSDYSVTFGQNGSIVLTNTVTNEVTTVYNLEYITFQDGGVMLNVKTETAFAAASLYEVILGRAADAGGHEFYAETSGFALIQAAESMLYSDEFTTSFGDIRTMTDQQFLDVLYSTAFDRPADAGGLQYWLDQIANGMSRAEVAVRFAYSAEAQNEFTSTINYQH